MNEIELRALLEEIDDLVSKAETTINPSERIKPLQEALFKACRYIKGLNNRIPNVIKQVLERGRFDPDQLMLPLRDIASSDKQLEIFRDKDILLNFLRAGRGLLRNQMVLSEDQIDDIFRHIEQTYDLFMDEKIAQEPLLEKFEDLQRFFCRPPWGGPGGPLVGPDPNDDGPSGVTLERTETVVGILGTLSSIGSFIIEILKHFPGAQLSEIEDEPIPYPYQILALCMMSGFVDYLDANQEIPEKIGTSVTA